MSTAALTDAPVEIEAPPRPELERGGGGTGGGDEDPGGGGGRGDGDGEFPFSGPKIALAFALFASTVLFVVTLACTLLLRRGAAVWPPEGAPPFPGILWGNTIVLVLSSFILRRGVRAIGRGDVQGLARGLFATTLLGIAFLLGQGRAWHSMLPVSAGPYVTIFYCLTWIHAAHVLGGLVFLAVCLVNALRGRYTFVQHVGVELCELYWHFLLAVWLVLVVWLAVVL